MMSDSPENSPKECNNAQSQEQTDEACLENLKHTVEDNPGVIGASIDRTKGEVKLEFDANFLNPDEVREQACRLQPELGRVFNKCTFCLAGRAAESCADKLAYRLEKVDGVRRASASYIGGALTVDYDGQRTSGDEILHNARDVGFAAEPLEQAMAREKADAEAAKQSIWGWLKYWLTGEQLEAVFCAVTLVSMCMGWVFLRLLKDPSTSDAFYILAYLAGGYFGVLAGWQSIRNLVVDIDLLMILAALGAAYVGAPFEGAMLLFLFSFSNVLQAFAMRKTRSAIESLAEMRPQSARLLKNGQPVDTPVDEISLGAKILIKPGDRIPLDGKIIEGESSVDQSSVTGESIPVNKAVNDPVFAGTMNQFGSLTVEVTKAANDSTIARLIQMVEEAQSRKATTQRFLDTAEQYYAIFVILFTIAVGALLPTAFGVPLDESLYRAITLMVVASPCALVISTPASILSAIANGARNGILFKGGASLEQASTIRVVSFDKTGTLTEGKP